MFAQLAMQAATNPNTQVGTTTNWDSFNTWDTPGLADAFGKNPKPASQDSMADWLGDGEGGSTGGSTSPWAYEGPRAGERGITSTGGTTQSMPEDEYQALLEQNMAANAGLPVVKRKPPGGTTTAETSGRYYDNNQETSR
jgi:hypothetical protein